MKTPLRPTVLHCRRLRKRRQTYFTLLGILSKYVAIFSFVYANDHLHLQLIPTKTEDVRQRAYINVAGAAVNSNKTDGFFQINAAQFTSHYKNERALSILPVQAHFNSNKYRTKKPIPSNDTYVSVEGFLEEIETDTAGHTTLFHVSVDNISFLGRASFSLSTAGGLSEHLKHFSVSTLIMNPSSQHPQHPPGLPASNSISTLHHQAHFPKPLPPVHLPKVLHCSLVLEHHDQGNARNRYIMAIM